MDRSPRDPAPADRAPRRPRQPGLPRVRVGAGPDLAAAVPHLLGFPPQESLVLVALTGPRAERLGLTLRVDLPPPDLHAAVAAQAVRSIRGSQPAAVVVLVHTEADDLLPAVHPGGLPAGPSAVPCLPRRDLIREVALALTAEGIAVRDVLLVRGGRCWSYDCPEPCCEPGAGTPLPTGVSDLELASVATGQVLATDRSQLRQRIAPVGGPAAAAMAAACEEVGAEYADQLARAGWEAVTASSWTVVRAALERCRPGSRDRLGDREVARVAWAVADRAVRDRALGLALGPDRAAAEALWTELTRRAPTPLDVAPATLLAVTVWLRGDGAMANVALDRALDGSPGYPLAQLLRSALDACLPPDELRRLVRSACADQVSAEHTSAGQTSAGRSHG